jgi:N-acetylmuramoyl-L-alanine amidase
VDLPADLAPDLKAGRVIPDDVWGILCIFAEARGEPYEGMVAVGNVIRNRTAKRHFSDGTVVGTVSKPYQFSWLNTGDAQRTRVLGACWDESSCRLAAQAWFESEHVKLVGDALWYHASYVSPAWAKAEGIEFVRRIGRHLFFRQADK